MAPAEVVNLSLVLITGIVAVAVVFGAVDLLRQPTWAWRAAGESKTISLLLVLLLPGVGLAIYVFGARPKVVEIAAAGRAAALPFERFADRAATAVESGRAIQALALSTTRGSFGETIVRPIRASGAAAGPPAGAGFFDDPDLLPVGVAAGSAGTLVSAPDAPVATEPTIRIPTQAGRPYNPKQRVSLDEGPIGAESLASAAAHVASGPPAGDGGGRAVAALRAPRPVAAAIVGVPLPTMAAPRVGTSTPEIFRARPRSVAPIAGSAPDTTAPQATMAARWMNDPTGRHQYRYWDGSQWTENVYDAGVESRDRVGG